MEVGEGSRYDGKMAKRFGTSDGVRFCYFCKHLSYSKSRI